MSAVPGQFNINLDSVLPPQQPESEGYIIGFWPPIPHPQEAIAIIVENGSKFNLNSKEMMVILQTNDSIPKQLLAWNRSGGHEITVVETGGSDFGPNSMLLLDFESDALVFRLPTVDRDRFKMDIPNFWNILGGRIVTFGWIGENGEPLPVGSFPLFEQLPHILAYQAATGDITIRKVNQWKTLFTNIVLLPEVWSAKGNKPPGTLSKGLSGLLPLDTPSVPMASTAKTRSWSSMVSFILNREPHMLSYDSSTGAVDIDLINRGGQGFTLLWEGSWSKAWTSITPFLLNGRPHLFLYKSTGNEGGRVNIDKINSNGLGATTQWSKNKWNTGYTSIVSYLLDREPFIFSYSSDTGLYGQTPIIKSNDGRKVKGLGPTASESISRGWTYIVKFYLGREPHILLYNSNEGDVEIRKISARGLVNIWQADWSKGWSSILSFLLDFEPYLLLYNSDNGEVVIEKINGGARGTTRRFRDVWPRGYNPIVPLALKPPPDPIGDTVIGGYF